MRLKWFLCFIFFFFYHEWRYNQQIEISHSLEKLRAMVLMLLLLTIFYDYKSYQLSAADLKQLFLLNSFSLIVGKMFTLAQQQPIACNDIFITLNCGGCCHKTSFSLSLSCYRSIRMLWNKKIEYPTQMVMLFEYGKCRQLLRIKS